MHILAIYKHVEFVDSTFKFEKEIILISQFSFFFTPTPLKNASFYLIISFGLQMSYLQFGNFFYFPNFKPYKLTLMLILHHVLDIKDSGTP